MHKLADVQGNDQAEPHMNNNSLKQTAVLFKHSATVPSVKSINMTRVDNIELVLFYQPQVSSFEPLLARYLIKL